MEINALQLYGLTTEIADLAIIFSNFPNLKLELNLVEEHDIKFFNEIKEKLKIEFSGVHCNFKLYESLSVESKKQLKILAGNTLIIPTAVEENSLVYPLSFFRRTKWLYKKIIQLIDLIKFKGLRRIVVGNEVSCGNYFHEEFWKQLALKINRKKNEWDHIGFHNHGLEFEKLSSGQTPLDILNKELDKDVIFQFDLTNSLISGHFSIELLKNYIDRIKSFHFRIEGVGNEKFYEDLFLNHSKLFDKKQLVVELKENSTQEMIDRIRWWMKLVSKKS